MACAPCDGWEEGHVFVYETSPNEKVVVSAQAWRAAETWTVAIIEATEATYEKRIAAFSLILKSLRPKGYQREMFTGRKARLLDAKRVVLITDFVCDLMQQFGIPGVGLSLIDAGRIVFEAGFGVKTLGKPDPVDANTLFLAASNTKALTTLLLALLADEKKLRWDQPVTEVYPGFALGDAETTRQVLVKHLVGACTGLPVKIASGYLTLPRPHRHPYSRGLPACSPQAALARSSNIAISWRRPPAMLRHTRSVPTRSLAPLMTRPCVPRCSSRWQ